VPDYTKALGADIAGFRIGVPRDYFFAQLHPDVAVAVEAAIQLLGKKTRQVRDVALPRFQFVKQGDIDVELLHYHAAIFAQSPEKYHPTSRSHLEEMKSVTATGYVESLKRIREARRDIARIFADVDILLLPTMREPAPLIDEVVSGSHRRPPSNVAAFNRFGLPALTLPCGFSKEGLPIGLQVVGPAFGESAVLSAAFAYQRSTDWCMRHPGIG
jgi:aspartyl-tRNA(Asn)/glutamyl-tRNA(Gln) amidotransferase subunit A